MLIVACSGESDEPGGGSGGSSAKAGSKATGGSAGKSVGGTANAGESGEGTGAVGAVGGFGAGGSFPVTGGVGGFPPGGSTSIGGSTGTPIPPGWSCLYSAYNDGVCDCGCNVRDPDCADNDIDECARCNTTGSCDFRACPGRIDPENITKCQAPPAGWVCSNFYYSDGQCDCGCGALDLDCEDETADSCEFCAAFNACSGGLCPGPIDPDNNAVCKVPNGWTCKAYFYADGASCDCGCGIVDPDCESDSRDVCDSCWNGCSNESCPGPIDEDNNAVCTGIPSSWTCGARFFGDGVICNCGCGAFDPDCVSTDIEDCDECGFEGSCSARSCPGTIDPNNTFSCVRPDPPSGWTCNSYRYADGYSCDCGCGVEDLDCADDSLAECQDCSACGSFTCPGLVDPTDTTECGDPPEDWECSLFLYGDGYCDCGCGVKDPDCPDALKTSCKRCSSYDESCSLDDCSQIVETDNSRCVGGAPPEWTCPRKFYKDQACDCGCGVRDPDCASGAASVCKFCNDEGSCSTSPKCPGTIDPADNSKCTN